MNAVECPINGENGVVFIHHANKSITDYVIIFYENVCDKMSHKNVMLQFVLYYSVKEVVFRPDIKAV